MLSIKVACLKFHLNTLFEPLYMKQYFADIWSNSNYRLAIYLGFISLLWLLSGVLFGDGSQSTKFKEATRPPEVTVEAQYIDAQSFDSVTTVRGRTRANSSVSLMVEVDGRLQALPAEEGQLVETGDVICELAVEDRALRLQQAKSKVLQSQLEYDGSLKLKIGGYQSRTAIASAKARLDSAKAELRTRELALANTKVRAPFAGVVERHVVDVGTFMKRGHQCAQLIDLNPIVVSGRVSEKEAASGLLGKSAKVTSITGQEFQGAVSLVGFEADEVTRTYLVEVEVNNEDMAIRSGMSATVDVFMGALPAHVISPALLSLDDQGRVGVRILDNDHRVEFRLVEVIGDHEQGVWVRGLPERTLLITVGQEYVSHGEKVDAVVAGVSDKDSATENSEADQ